MQFPFVTRFRATGVWRAFTLNSIVSAIVIVMGVVFKEIFDMLRLPKDERSSHPKTHWGSVFISMFLTFVTSLVVYSLMYSIFDFGGGMLVEGAQTPPVREIGRGSRRQ